MKRLIVTAAVAACLAGWLGVREASADRESPGSGGKTMFRAVVHVNFDDAERQKNGLKNVSNMLKEVKEADIEVVCHGGGIGLVVKEKSGHTAEVDRLAKAGVRFAACENTMREKGVKKEDLLPGVVTVPSGAVEVVRKQQEGYGYFKP